MLSRTISRVLLKMTIYLMRPDPWTSLEQRLMMWGPTGLAPRRVYPDYALPHRSVRSYRPDAVAGTPIFTSGHDFTLTVHNVNHRLTQISISHRFSLISVRIRVKSVSISGSLKWAAVCFCCTFPRLPNLAEGEITDKHRQKTDLHRDDPCQSEINRWKSVGLSPTRLFITALYWI